MLNFERTARFNQKVVTKPNYIPPERLPPTSDAATVHSHLVYNHVQAWLGNTLDPTTYGWDLRVTEQGSLIKPHTMYQIPTPTSLLKIIWCYCSGRCDRNTCSFRKNSILCSPACGMCKGTPCNNVGTDDSTDKNPLY